MPGTTVDEYLAEVDEPGRRTLEALRAVLLRLLPDAEEGMAYGAPAYRVDGKVIAGFSASAKHLSYLPHSGEVLGALGDAVAHYPTSKGALRFPRDEPLPEPLVERLVAARRAEALR
jgi:uncharacterized protein YdhG (YjbR/CyaY superfamily)